MYLKIEMNEQEEIDLDFEGTPKQAVIMLITAMEKSDDLYKIFKKSVEAYEAVVK